MQTPDGSKELAQDAIRGAKTTGRFIEFAIAYAAMVGFAVFALAAMAIVLSLFL